MVECLCATLVYLSSSFFCLLCVSVDILCMCRCFGPLCECRASLCGCFGVDQSLFLF